VTYENRTVVTNINSVRDTDARSEAASEPGGGSELPESAAAVEYHEDDRDNGVEFDPFAGTQTDG
jgi:hypothetical protein